MGRTPYWLAAATFCVIMLAQALSLGPTSRAPSTRNHLAASSPAAPGGELAPSSSPNTASQSLASLATSATETVPTATPTPVPDKGKLIVIDAGHGGADPGAVHIQNGQADLLEAEVNLSIARRLATLLEQDGYRVLLTRTDSESLASPEAADLQARVDVANDAGADLLISIHHNGSEDGTQRGTEVLFCGDRTYADQNRQLAQQVQEALVRNLRSAGYEASDRGIVDDISRGHLALLAPANLDRPSRMPAIIGEALFMTNDQDAAALKREDIREAIARGYFEGIKAYFGDTS